MSLEFTISPEGNKPLVFRTGLPPEYSGPVIGGADSYFVLNNTAQITLQMLQGRGYTIRLASGYIGERVHAKGWIHTEGLYSNIMLKNSTEKQIMSLGPMLIAGGQYGCYYTQPSDCSALFAEKSFEMLDLFFSPALLQEMMPYFPGLKSVIGASPGVMLTQQSAWLTPAVMETANQLLHCRDNAGSRQFYIDLKVREILYHMLEDAFHYRAVQMKFTPWEVDRIYEARRILESCIDRKPPSLRKLARLVALNEDKLKRGFRQYFDAAIRGWIKEQKLQHSRQLILNTNSPIKVICRLVGYPLTANFITAFKRRFGVTPGDLRRK